MTAPTIAEMGDAAADIVWRVMGKGSLKSDYGDWLLKDRPTHDYHIARAVRHLATAQMQLHKSTPCPDNNGETATDHLERALVRCLFTLAQIKKEVPRLLDGLRRSFMRMATQSGRCTSMKRVRVGKMIGSTSTHSKDEKKQLRLANTLLGKTTIPMTNEAGSIVGYVLAGGCHQPHHPAAGDWLRLIQNADALVGRTRR